ncbi:MAG: transposase [Candidatus Anammoxibacter sp.]
MSRIFIEKGSKTREVIKHSRVSSSTWYNHLKKKEEDGRKENKGRPCPGYSLDHRGVRVYDKEIIYVLKSYRRKVEFINAGGSRKLSSYLYRDYGYIVNHKKVYRLCKANELLLPRRKKISKAKGKRICQNRTVSNPNELWELDLKYGYIHGEERFYFILIIIDVFLRYVVNYHIGLSCTGKDLVLSLNRAIEDHKPDGDQLVIRSDNGSQMTSKAFIENIKDYENEVIHELIPTATPNKNAHVEAFNSILEIEFLQVRYFNNYSQAYEETVEFIHKYNTERIHGSLKWQTPSEAREIYLGGGDLGIKKIRL